MNHTKVSAIFNARGSFKNKKLHPNETYLICHQLYILPIRLAKRNREIMVPRALPSNMADQVVITFQRILGDLYWFPGLSCNVGQHSVLCWIQLRL